MENRGLNLHFFANNRLKSTAVASDHAMDILYPLYATLVYKQTNTQFKVIIDGNPILVTEDLNELESDPLASVINEYKLTVLKLAHLEATSEGFDNYSIKGFGKWLSLYQEDIALFFQRQTLKDITSFINIFDHGGFNSFEVDVMSILWTLTDLPKADISILDWKVNEGKLKFKKLLMADWATSENAEHGLKFVDMYFDIHLHNRTLREEDKALIKTSLK